ncbi:MULTISPECIES: DUF2281 domain-containing protein [Thiorhodovibrio]|uniref:DUF2281 domain-containing protein n=1 Tax=Thiorhodovibrio TaxID=61593 RepID=UPI0019123052|nr:MULTISPECIES: DUF2281 domain-containing protein [Thiorhodovibrio]WPL11177.1 hypothetical protein Thiosp_00905 [Thiorhodovibrio litoralis]
MSIAEIIYAHSRRLPEQAAREALSYIEFLEQRYAVTSPTDDVKQEDTEAFLRRKRRVPPPALAGKVRELGDVMSSASASDWGLDG